MKHHFADLLDRSNDYWTIVPNVKRYGYSLDSEIADKDSVKILTISKDNDKWKQILSCHNLEELTLNNPSKEQVYAITALKNLRRLRVSFLRTSDIEFIGELNNLEELVLEYVSGFSDLSPLRKLSKLKSIHFENLRKVSNFDGLKGINSLRYLHIGGTLDWKQPIENFSFLAELPNLEIISFGFVINKNEYPAFLPILKLKQIKKIKIGMATFNTKEYAFLEQTFSADKCCNHGNNTWTPCYQINEEYMEFIGKGAGKVKLNNPNAKEKIANFIKQYEEYKKDAQLIISKNLTIHCT